MRAGGPPAGCMRMVVVATLVATSGLHAQDTDSVPAADRGATGQIVGRVVEAESGAPVAGADLWLSPLRRPAGEVPEEGPPGEAAPRPPGALERGAATSVSGAFSFSSVPPGDYELRVRHLALGERTVAVRVEARATTRLTLRLEPRPIAVAPLDVLVESEIRPLFLERRGFYDRRERGWGTFFDPAWARLWSTGQTRFEFDRFLDFYAPAFPNLPSCRGGGPVVYVDGHRDRMGSRWPGSWSEVGAIEVYQNRQGVPPFVFEYEAICGAIVIWTKRW